MFIGFRLALFGQAGDIAFIGFNSDNQDEFAFFTFKAIPGNSVIYFTDEGWKSDNTFRSNESTLTWTSPAAGIPAGTIVSIGDTASIGTIEASLTLAEGADQILAFTGTEDAPVFLAAIQFNTTNAWDDDATSTSTSALPAGLENEVTALALPAKSNFVYAGSMDVNYPALLEKINSPGNWYGSNNFHFQLTPETFPCYVMNSSGDWNETDHWQTATLPNNETNVIIAENVDAKIESSNASCHNLFIESRGTVSILSGYSHTVNNDLNLYSRSRTYAAAIINYGTLTIGGTTTYHRWIPGQDRHIVASPVTGQTLYEFATAHSIQYFEDKQSYDLAPYNETSNGWGPYTDENNSNTMAIGSGYAMRRDAGLTSEGTVRFSGALNLSDTEIPLTRNDQGWNCIGNPFAAPISGTGTDNESFLRENIDKLDPDYGGLYLWDYETNDYLVYTHSSSDKIAPCQGFIVRSKTGGEQVDITKGMQTIASPSFKSIEIPRPNFTVVATCETNKNQTKIVFDDNSTTGLDPGLDAGKLKGNPNFSLYTRFMEPYPVDFAVQALPLSGHEMYRIPLGLDCTEGGEVTFTAISEEIPADMALVLEDVQTKSFTRLDNNDAGYVAQVEPGKTGTGRFFISTVEKGITQSATPVFRPQMYLNSHHLVIHQAVPETQVVVFNAAGKICFDKMLHQQGRAVIDVSGMAPGLYLVQLNHGNNTIREKIIMHP